MRRPRPAAFLLASLIAGLASAQERVDAASLVRSRLAEARRALGDGGKLLSEQERLTMDAALTRTEQALARYEQLAARGGTRKKAMVPLAATGATVIADDATGVGVVDDVLIPFVAIGLMVTYLSTEAPATETELESAWTQVMNSLKEVSRTVVEIEVARKRNDGMCYCSCVKSNDGPYPLGRRTPAQCQRDCEIRGYTLGICK